MRSVLVLASLVGILVLVLFTHTRSSPSTSRSSSDHIARETRPSLAGASAREQQPLSVRTPEQRRRDAQKDPRRGKRWEARLERVDVKVRARLGVDTATADALLDLQRDFRVYQQYVKDRFIRGELTKDELASFMQSRFQKLHYDVQKLVGPEVAADYWKLVDQEHASDRPNARHAQG